MCFSDSIPFFQCWSCGGACGCGWRADGQGDYRRRLPHPFPLLPGGKLLVGVLGGREYSTSSLPPPPHTQFLRGDDATLRRLRRQRLSRSFHHSLPSLLHSLPPSSLSPSPSSPPRRRLPADGAEGGGGGEDDLGNPISSSPSFSSSSSSSSSSSPSPSPYHQVFFDAERFHDDELEAKRIEEEEEEADEEEEKRRNGKKRRSYRAVPASPHPLQKSRLVKRSPLKSRIGRNEEEEGGEEGIVELRYTLNFSTPVLHEADLPFSMSSRGDLPLCVNSRDLPFSISTHIQHGPRVSFQEDLKSGKKSKKKKRKTSSRSAGNSRSSKDIRLKMEWSACLSDEKLSPPMVEYKVSDLGLLCPLRRMKMAKGEDEKLISEGSAAGEGMGNSYCSAAAASALNHRWRAQVNQPEASKIKKANTTSSTFSSMTTEPATVASGVARSNAHVFSTVIVHRVGGNVHM